MSHDFVPVQWNRQKFVYDATLLAAVFIFLVTFIISGTRAESGNMMILMIRSFGALSLIHISEPTRPY